MASSIRLADAGLPDTPPPGSARIFVDEYNGRLHLKMIRPDGTVEIFGNLGLPLEVDNGGTGTSEIPEIGQILIGDGTKYTPGNIIAGNRISVVKTADSIQINADVQDFSLDLATPPEFSVTRLMSLGETTLILNKTDQEANKIYAGPVNGQADEPNFRFLSESDIPNLNFSKIIELNEEIRRTIPTGLQESSEISFNYDEFIQKTSFLLNNTGVTAGIYGSDLEIPVITIDSKGRITSATSVNAKEAVEDYVGTLITSSESVNAEYDDLNSKLYLHVNEETLITTNISDSENTKAPTSQSIKQYVDDNLTAERTSRVNSIANVQSKLEQLEQELLDQRIFSCYDNFVITAEDIERGYLTLSNKNVLFPSVTALVNRVPLLQEIDFVISNDSQDNVIFTFIGDILPNQQLALEDGENIRVNYFYKS